MDKKDSDRNEDSIPKDIAVTVTLDSTMNDSTDFDEADEDDLSVEMGDKAFTPPRNVSRPKLLPRSLSLPDLSPSETEQLFAKMPSLVSPNTNSPPTSFGLSNAHAHGSTPLHKKSSPMEIKAAGGLDDTAATPLPSLSNSLVLEISNALVDTPVRNNMSTTAAALYTPLPLNRSKSLGISSVKNTPPVHKHIRRSFGWKQVEDDDDSQDDDNDVKVGLACNNSSDLYVPVPYTSSGEDEDKEEDGGSHSFARVDSPAMTPEMNTIDGMEGFSTCTYDDDETATDDNVCPICLCSYGE